MGLILALHSLTPFLLGCLFGACNLISMLRPASEPKHYHVGNNVLRNQTDMSTRPCYFQLSLFFYLLYVFLYCGRFTLVPM